MPRGDGTGPEGKGPMTGRGAGPCGGNEVAGVESAGRGRGLGRRSGRARRNRIRSRGVLGRMGLGWGGGAADLDENKDTKKRFLQRQLDGIQRRLAELGEERERQ